MPARFLRVLLILPVAAALLCNAYAAQAPPSGSSGPAVSRTAPVTLDGETLFNLPGISAYPAEQRAQLVSQAILDLAKDPTFQPGTLQIQEQQGYLDIKAGERVIVSVTELDATAEQLASPLLAQVLVRRIDAAVRQYRESRRPEALFRDVLEALAEGLGFALALYLFVRVWRYLEGRAERVYKKILIKSPARALGTGETENLWSALRNMMRLLRSVIILIGALFVLNSILGLFPWTKAYSQYVLKLVLDPLATMSRGALNSIPDIIFLVMLYFVTKFLLRLAQTFFRAVHQGLITIPGFYSEWGMPSYGLVRILIISFAIVVGYPYLPGSDSEAFKGVSLLLGLLFSIGSSSVVANIIAGYSLIYRRTFHVGDRVQIGDVIGDVQDVRFQVTKIRTLKNEEVIIPNSQILHSNVTNYSSLMKKNQLILHTTVGIGYETPWRQVEAMLLMAASRTKELLVDPPPFVLQKQLGDFAVLYEINAYCDQPHRQPELYTALHRHILDVFNEYGVQIMTPAYEGDPEVAKVVPKSKWFESPAGNLGALSQEPAKDVRD